VGSSSTETDIKNQLQFTLDRLCETDAAIIVTTFSSHIERLKSMLQVNDGRRKVAMIGRSLKEYTKTASDLGYLNLKNVEIASRREEVNDLFEKISDNEMSGLLSVQEIKEKNGRF
jgi:mRNA degradation ribonuclease J1/J2